MVRRVLERNKIYLGDSYKLIKEIPDNSVDCIYVDIPYLYKKGGNSQASLVAQRIVKNNNSLIEAGITDGIDITILDEFIRVCKKINIFIWCSKDQIYELLSYFDKIDCTFQFMFWGKTNPTPMCNGNWLPDVEYLLYFNRGAKLNNGYDIKSKYYISQKNKKDKDLYDHPTIKPLDLVKRHLLHTTQPNDLVLDCFSGSGTTCVACKEIGRDYIGIEIDPNYHKISVDRLNGITSNGQTSIFTEFDKL